MIDKSKILVVIPARGGSKGIPGKNIKLLKNKPLILYTIEFARKIFQDAQIVVSTDDDKIKHVVQQTGLSVPYLRDVNLATDTTPTIDVIFDILQKIDHQYIEAILLLQPTSPFRLIEDLFNCLALFDDTIDMVASVKKSKENPYFNLFEENEFGFIEKSKKGLFTNRQSAPEVYSLNGSIYVMNKKTILHNKLLSYEKVVKYEMDKIYSLDLDDLVDWQFAEFLVQNSLVDFD